MAEAEVLASGIADRLRTISGLAVYNGWPDLTNPPCAIIDQAGYEPEQTMGRGEFALYRFDLEVLVPLKGGEANARRILRPLMATSSTGGVFGAIAGDRTLGGVASATFVKAASKPERRTLEDSGIAVLQVTFPLEVWS
jgi:hypothetical protein